MCFWVCHSVHKGDQGFYHHLVPRTVACQEDVISVSEWLNMPAPPVPQTEHNVQNC